MKDVFTKLYSDEYEAIISYTMFADWLKNKRIFKLVKLFDDIKKDEMEHVQELYKRASDMGISVERKLERPIIDINSIEDIFKKSIELEQVAIDGYNSAIAVAQLNKDFVSEQLFKHILEEETDHQVDFDDELAILTKMGEPMYLTTKVNESNLTKEQLFYKALYEAKIAPTLIASQQIKQIPSVVNIQPKQKQIIPPRAIQLQKYANIKSAWQKLLDAATKQDKQTNNLEELAKGLVKYLDDYAWKYTKRNDLTNIFVKFDKVDPDILKIYFTIGNKEYDAELSLNPNESERKYDHVLLKRDDNIVDLWNNILTIIGED